MNKRLAISLSAVGLYAVVAGTWIGVGHLSTNAASGPVRLPEWHAFQACMTGPLEDGERASMRVRDIRYAQATASDEDGDNGSGQWPKSCRSAAKALLEALDAVEPSEGAKTRSAWWCLRGAIDNLETSLGLEVSNRDLDGAYDCARRFVTPASAPAANGPQAPAAPRVFGPLPDVGHGSLAQSDQHLTPTLRIRLGAQYGFCRVVAGGEMAQCDYLPDPLARDRYGLQLVPTSVLDDTFAFRRGRFEKVGVYSLRQGRAVFEPEADSIWSAFVGDSGSPIAVGRAQADDEHATLFRRELGVDVAIPLHGVAPDPRVVRLVGEHLLWLDDSEPRHLLARKHDAPTATDLGRFDSWLEGPIVSCETDGVIFARLDATPTRLLAATEEGYRLLVATPISGTMSCHAGKAAFTQSDAGGVRVQRCTPEACASAVVAEASSSGHAIALEDAVVVIRHEGKGLRLRISSIDALDSAPERVIVDADPLGHGLLIHDLSLLAREDTVYLLVHASEGTQLFRIDAQGTVTPISPR